MVRSHLDYAQSVWSPYKKKHMIAIENVQKRATKQLPGMKDLTYKQRLQKLELPTLSYRRIRGDMIEVYKITHDLYDPEVSNLLIMHNTSDEGITTRGHEYKLQKRRAKGNIRKHSFTHRVIDTWNNLPSKVVEAPSISSFKRRLDKYWEGQDILYDFQESITKQRNCTIQSDEELDLTIEAC